MPRTSVPTKKWYDPWYTKRTDIVIHKAMLLERIPLKTTELRVGDYVHLPELPGEGFHKIRLLEQQLNGVQLEFCGVLKYMYKTDWFKERLERGIWNVVRV